MRLHRVTLHLSSGSGTPWQSDTLFGHLCWAYRYEHGEDALLEWLKPFLKGDPPFVLSDGFPQGLLPRPLLPRGRDARPGSVDEYDRQKAFNKAAYMEAGQFGALASGKGSDVGASPGAGWSQHRILHASIDRNTGSTGGEDSAGNLFETIEMVPTVDGEVRPAVDVYVLAGGGGLDECLHLMRAVAQTGYGKDKSVGKGQFTVDENVEDVSSLLSVGDAIAFVSLSSYVPASDDPTDGWWRLRVKRGKVGEMHMSGPNPFKRAILQFEPGAVFRTVSPPKQIYGRIVRHVSTADDRIVQNCQTIALPILLG